MSTDPDRPRLVEFVEYDADHASRSEISEYGSMPAFKKLKPQKYKASEGGVNIVPISNDAIREAVRSEGWKDTFAQRATQLNPFREGKQELLHAGGAIRQMRAPRMKWLS